VPIPLTAVDIAIFLASILIVLAIGLWAGRKEDSAQDFFLAGRTVPWWGVAGSIFGTNVSAEHLVGMLGIGYSIGFAQAHFEYGAIAALLMLAFIFLPLYRAMGVYTLSEYLAKRYDERSSVLYSAYSILSIVFVRMALGFYIGARALSYLLDGTPLEIGYTSGILIFATVTATYTIVGGLKAVIWTDVVQVFVLYGGALLSLIILLYKTDGGLGAIVSAGIDYDKFHMFNWTWDWTTTAVWVVIVGNFFLNLVPYTSDQAVVQRYFTTKDEKAAAKSIWTNAALLVPSTLTLFLLGTGLWAFYRANPELLNPTLPTDSIFPLFIAQQLPAGIAGLLIAAVFAASMSTLDSSLNSVSAALVTDFYVRFRPAADDARRLLLARLLTAGLGVLATATSIALATFDIGSLWDTFQGMMGLLGGGLAGLFALGIFFRSANGAGAMTGAVASVFILFWVQQHTDLHFFLYGAVGILSCILVALATSPFYRSSRA